MKKSTAQMALEALKSLMQVDGQPLTRKGIDIAEARAMLAIAALEAEISVALCKECGGEGAIHTGFDEAPLYQCSACHGTGIPAPQEPEVNAGLLEALMELVANQDLTWRLAGFTEEQIQAMPYLQASRAAITKAGGAA